MLDIKFIRENIQKVKQACRNKKVKVDVEKLLKLDKERRKKLQKIEEIRAKKNKTGKEISSVEDKREKEKIISEMKKIDKKGDKLKKELREVDDKFQKLLYQVPNIPFDNVPIGRNENDNVVVRKVGKKPEFSFKPKDYLSIAEKLDLIDIKRAAKVSGTRFGYLKKGAALLEFALIKFGLDVLTKQGFIPVIPPVMLRPEMAKGTGYFEAIDEKEAYFIPQDNLYLAGTAEQPLVAMHSNEVFNEKDLPRRYVGFSACFRREAGSYGKDTKGILRVHQFDKLEMVSFCASEESKEEHRYLLSLEEKLMKALKLPYRVVNISTGDLGMPAAAKYDIETWIPSENRYRETHSTSNCTDFQARRLNIRYREKNGKLNFVHTLNGTAFAMGRIIIAIIENHQQKDGEIRIPPALQKYLDFKVIK